MRSRRMHGAGEAAAGGGRRLQGLRAAPAGGLGLIGGATRRPRWRGSATGDRTTKARSSRSDGPHPALLGELAGELAGGASTGATGMSVVEAPCRFLNGVRRFEELVREREEFLRREIERLGVVVGEMDVKLVFDVAGRVTLHERTCDAVIATKYFLRTSGHLIRDVGGSLVAA